MKHFWIVLQLMAMSGDIILFVVIGYSFYSKEPVLIGASFLALYAFQDVGGFMCWRPSIIKQFRDNWKAMV